MVIHPFKGYSSLSKGDSSYSPFHSPFLNGEFSFQKLIHLSRSVIHPSKRVNGRVNRRNHPSKGEWGLARYTSAKISCQYIPVLSLLENIVSKKLQSLKIRFQNVLPALSLFLAQYFITCIPPFINHSVYGIIAVVSCTPNP